MEFRGAGYWEGLEDSHGPASQFAIFRRNTKREEVFNPVSGDERSWEVVESYEYPAKADTRSEDERLEDELNYYVRQLAWDKRNEEDPDLARG